MRSRRASPRIGRKGNARFRPLAARRGQCPRKRGRTRSESRAVALGDFRRYGRIACVVVVAVQEVRLLLLLGTAPVSTKITRRLCPMTKAGIAFDVAFGPCAIHGHWSSPRPHFVVA